MGMMDGSLVLPSPLALEQARSFWVLLIVAGLSAVLSAYAWVLTVIKITGGFYLLWLAFKAFKSAAAKHDIGAHAISVKDSKPLTYFLRGLAIQMTNPKASLSWIAIISLGLQEGTPLWVGTAIVIGTFILSLTLHSVYALAFSTPTMVSVYGRARRKIQATLGVFFTFAGLKPLTSRT